MNNKPALLFTFAMLAYGSIAVAQNTTWLTTGNALTVNGKLGTTSSKNVDFITNNKTRMTLTSGGNLNISSDQTAIQFPVPGSTPKPMLFMFPTGAFNTNRMVLAHSPAFSNFGLQYNDTDDRFDFVSEGNSVFNINLANNIGAGVTGNFNVTGNSSFNGNVVIGAANINSSLRVIGGNSGISPLPNSTIYTENGGDNFISVLAPTSNKTAILFGTGNSNQDGAIVYNNPAVKSGMQFNTSSTTRMTITSKGFIGVGTIAPATELHVMHGGTGALDGINHGIRLQNTNGHQWTWFVNSTNGELDLLKDNKIAGYFDPFNGDYISGYLDDFAPSQQTPDVLQKLMLVSVKQYEPAPGKRSNNRFAISAQEAAKVFPEMVNHRTENANGSDLLSISNSTATSIAIKAIQEQQHIIEALKKEVEDLKATVNKTAIAGNSGINKTSAVASSAFLKQNTPNPFTTVTTINYYVPQTTGNATIELISASGQLLKTFPVTGGSNGQLTLEAAALPAGTYTYALKVSGIKVDAKQMVLIK